MTRPYFSCGRLQQHPATGQRTYLTLSQSLRQPNILRIVEMQVVEDGQCLLGGSGQEMQFPGIFCRSSRENQLLCYVPKPDFPDVLYRQLMVDGYCRLKGAYRLPDLLCRRLHLPAGTTLCGRLYSPVSVSGSHWGFTFSYRP